MQRVTVPLLLVVIIIAVASVSGPGGGMAQGDEPDYIATIEVYETRVAELEATVDARGRKINAQRTQIAELKTQANNPTATVEPRFESGGLGLHRTEWEEVWGVGKGNIDDGFLIYHNDTLVVFYLDEKIRSISWNLPQAVAIEDAREIAASKLPVDAQYISTGINDSGEPRDYYLSASLASRFDPDLSFWGTSGPGSCMITYYAEPDGSISAVSISIGDR